MFRPRNVGILLTTQIHCGAGRFACRAVQRLHRAPDVAGAFGQSCTHVIATAGTAHGFGETYLALGLGVSY